VVYLENVLTAPTHLQSILRTGDVLLTLGAGDVWKVGEGVLKLIEVDG
jgi:UDP-N-acetylmuramate-alanine ligase